MHRFRAGAARNSARLVVDFVALAGCGSEEDAAPAACTNGAGAIRTALRAAPGPVQLEGSPLSACLSEKSEGQNLQVVGGAFVEAAADLADEARRSPDGAEALQLGYLIGAARSGGSDTQGIHAELLRRLDQELGAFNTSTPAFRRGLRAGLNE